MLAWIQPPRCGSLEKQHAHVRETRAIRLDIDYDPGRHHKTLTLEVERRSRGGENGGDIRLTLAYTRRENAPFPSCTASFSLVLRLTPLSKPLHETSREIPQESLR